MTDIPARTSLFDTDPVNAVGANHTIKALIEHAQQVVRMARALATANRTVDLVGLEHLIGVLCAQTLDLPPVEGRVLRALLEALLAECEALDDILHHPIPPRQKAASCPYPSRPS